MNNIYKIIYNEIKKYKTIYIVRHIGPDPDALGSQLALKESIKLTFPSKNVYALGASVSRFKYLGKLDKIDKIDYEKALVITVDVPDIKRVDVENFTEFKNVIKIDHHPLIDKFSDLEHIDENASSASEMILELINNTKLKMNEKIAKNIYFGIVSDSNRFLYNVNHKTLLLCSDLIKKYEINLNTAYSELYGRPLSEVRLMGHIASNLKVDNNGFAYIELDDEILSAMNADISAPSNMINDFNNINEILVWTFITFDTKNNLYKINIRSRGPEINIVASKYNGGGHKFASGVRTNNKDTINMLINDLKEACRNYKKEREK